MFPIPLSDTQSEFDDQDHVRVVLVMTIVFGRFGQCSSPPFRYARYANRRLLVDATPQLFGLRWRKAGVSRPFRFSIDIPMA